jgi:hypothetical protein
MVSQNGPLQRAPYLSIKRHNDYNPGVQIQNLVAQAVSKKLKGTFF